LKKSSFAFIALPVPRLIAPSAFAVRYLTVDQAQAGDFFPANHSRRRRKADERSTQSH